MVFSMDIEFWFHSCSSFSVFKRLFHYFLSIMASDEKVVVNHRCFSICIVSIFKIYSLPLAFNNLPCCILALGFLVHCSCCLYSILYLNILFIKFRKHSIITSWNAQFSVFFPSDIPTMYDHFIQSNRTLLIFQVYFFLFFTFDLSNALSLSSLTLSSVMFI